MKNEASNITVVILAAGASNRMDEPKQLLKWGNSTLLGSTIEKAKMLNVKDVIVVLGANYLLISKIIKQSKITILNNVNWKNGLGSSIAFAVKHIMNDTIRTDATLFMLADQPFIEVDFLNTMINQFQEGKQSILATSYDENKYGVPVIFSKSYFKELIQLNDDKGAKHLLKKYKYHVKVLIPPAKNVDLDFKKDYLKLYKTYFKK